MDWIHNLKFDAQGLIPAIVQDVDNGEVLMLGYMNSDSLATTLKKGLVTFYSRSRQKLWTKGESSGHTQEVREVFFDCDQDALLIKVKQNVAACHEGYRTCFFRKVDQNNIQVIASRVFDPKEKY